MRVINHKDQPTEQWRPEVTTRMLVSAVVGSSQLCKLHLQFAVAAPIFEAAYEDHHETARRWRPAAG
jgi:hypothetical protein